MSIHVEKIKSSKTIPWKYFETINVRDGRGKLYETMTVVDIEEGKFKNYITFKVERH